MKMKIIQVGKSKETDFDNVGRELLKRISGFAEVEMVTVPEAKTSATFGSAKAIAAEGEEVLEAIGKDRNIVVLDERGREMDSIQFSKLMEKHEDLGDSLCFVIGGPFGLSEEVKKRATQLLSMSKMTFTHQMIRIFLLEQLYRAFCIIRGKEYHHE